VDELMPPLADILRRAAAAWPERPAMVSGGDLVRYGELDARASRVARGLVAEGCGPQERVAILARNGVAFAEILMGTLKAGAVALPLNWRLAAPELAYILRHAEVRILFGAAEFAAAAQAAAAEAGVQRCVVIGADGGYAAWRDSHPANDPLAPASAADVALQMYTSGTTGLPKGVQLSHGAYGAALESVRRFAWGRLSEEDVVLTPAPFFHVNGVNPVLRTFAAGALVAAPPQFGTGEVLELIETRRVTRATLAPAMIQACLEDPDLATRDVSSLEVISYGGSPISEPVLEAARAAFGCSLVQMYGLTETSGPLTFLHPEDHDPAKGWLQSCGRPGDDVEIRVTDADGTPLPAGETGEVRVRAPGIMSGYWRDAAATDEVLRDGWFRTGDAGFLDAAGYLHIRDRVKDMIVSGGENIYPAEVENALLSHPAVADAAVIGAPDPRWGEAVKALVVRRPGVEASAADIVAHVRTRIAGYKTPKSIDWVDEIPRNAAGKILRRHLRAPFWAGQDRNVA
jgi:acyl-CoA synthetase (AMP-forming)/AMP-acid ligase II